MLHEVETNVAKSVFSDYSDGEKQTSALFNRSGVFLAPKHGDFVSRFVSHATGKRDVVLDCFGGSGSTAHGVISLNRFDGGQRRYIIIEQGEYFWTVIKPRIQKVVFSSSWTKGKPTSPDSGVSHILKVLKIESYEDTLNNLMLERTSAQQLALETIPATEQDGYRMRYMLDIESRGSLLNVEQFRKPWGYKLDIATDSAGASEPVAVDLIETFNYLLGLTVDTIDIDLERGFATITGWEPSVAHTSENRTLIVWRDCDRVDDDGLRALTRKYALNPGDAEFARVFVNGDHSLPSVIETDEGGEKTIALLPIEPQFLARMWDVKDV
jgi:adenine-specific DNA-methyltransferase